MRFVLLFLFLLTGCGVKPVYHLRWDVDEASPVTYRTTIANPAPEQNIVQKNVFELAEDSAALDDAIQNLKTMVLNPQEMPLITTITKLGTPDNLEIRMVAGKTEYATPPQDEIEETKRKIESQTEGMIHLFAFTNFYGENKSFYLKQVQKNLIALFFQLPRDAVKPGDQWSLPTNLIEVGAGFVPDNSNRINKVWVRSAYKDPQLGNVLEVVYLIGEYISGNFVQTTTTKEATLPFEMSFSFVAYGEYLADKGRWKRYVGQMSTKGRGSIQLESHNLYSLYPVN